MSTSTVLRLEIPPRPSYVSLVRLVVATAAQVRRDLDPERVEDLALALSEACTNAIEAHSAAAVGEDIVSVEVEEADDRLIVTITDQGKGFDPMAVPQAPAPTDPQRLQYDRGLGIPIIRQVVDEFTVISDEDGGGTRVRMVVLCPPAPEADLDIDLDDLGDLEDAWNEE